PGRLFALGGPLDFRLRDIGVWAPWAGAFLRSCDTRTFEAGAEALGGLMARGVDAWSELLALADSADLMRRDGHAMLWVNTREAEAGRRAWETIATGSARARDLPHEDLDRYRAVMPGRPPVAGLAIDGTARLASPERV